MPGELNRRLHAALAAGNPQAAFALVRDAVSANPRTTGPWCALAELYLALEQPGEARAAVQRALALSSDDAGVLELAGVTHDACGDAVAALAAYERCLQRDPTRLRAQLGRIAALLAGDRAGDALERARALTGQAHAPAPAWRLHGEAALATRDFAEAMQAFERHLEQVPDDAQGWHNLGHARDESRQATAAQSAYERALACAPTLWPALSQLLWLERRRCDWRHLDAHSAALRRAVAAGEPGIAPFGFLSEPATPAEQLRCARTQAAQILAEIGGTSAAIPRTSRATTNARVRVGFVSNGFNNHPTGLLVVELIERLRDSDIETLAFATSAGDGGALRDRLSRAFVEFHDVHALAPVEIARRIAASGVDVLVDLRGYGGGHVADVFARRPAPVQVNWLAYPGTTGAPWMDYLIADRHVVPPSQRAHYSEHVVQLPRSFQPCDATRVLLPPPARIDCGLPASGPVLASFNNSYKIGPEVFGRWMEILRAVPEATLWLLDPGDDGSAARHLRAQAQARGIDGARLVLMDKAPHADYLARYALVDLFLDTWPYGAHTTASDALYAGCPVLTLPGETFASRVATSLLSTLDLPELIARDADDYVQRAIGLARDVEARRLLRAKLADPARRSALFDMTRFAADFARALATMADRSRRGLPPESFTLPS